MNRWKASQLVGVALLAAALGGLGVRTASAQPERRLESALRLLREAREELIGARAGGGHREQALDFTERAIRQVEEGMGGDRHRDRR